MTMAYSPIARTLVIAEDARLAAQISCALALPGHYLPVAEGPPFLPADPAAELVRRNNAAARARPESIFMIGLSGQRHKTHNRWDCSRHNSFNYTAPHQGLPWFVTWVSLLFIKFVFVSAQ
jgi:hypothetical protein